MNKTGSVPPLMAIHFLVFSREEIKKKKKLSDNDRVLCNTQDTCVLLYKYIYILRRGWKHVKKYKNLNSTIIFSGLFICKTNSTKRPCVYYYEI